MYDSPDSVSPGRNFPVFRINLSLPPSERYVALARLYRDRMRSMRGIFDALVKSASPRIPVDLVHWLCRTCLRRLYTDEETEEIRGISLVTDIDLYLLVCLNTVLDLLMGCTSGGVRTMSGSQTSKSGAETKMLHFRTLDWAMDPLRDLIVQLEFVRDSDPHKVLATSINYVGFVGMLTGVRKNLSVSLNFRPVHDVTGNFAFYSNHLLVLLGMRQSVSSLLRQCILSPQHNPHLSDLKSIVENVPSMPTTAAYFIFSDGQTTVTMEKDHRTAVVRSSSSFIAMTNHDHEPDPASLKTGLEETKISGNQLGLTLVTSDARSLSDLIEDSKERHDCIQSKWNDKVRKHRRMAIASEKKEKKKTRDFDFDQPQGTQQGTRSSLRLRQKREENEEKLKPETHILYNGLDDAVAITQEEAISWLTTYPTLNESTHYAVLMDPSSGRILWGRRYEASEWEE